MSNVESYSGISRGRFARKWLFCDTCEVWLPMSAILRRSWKCRTCGSKPVICEKDTRDHIIREKLVAAKERIVKLQKDVLIAESGNHRYPSDIW